MNKDSYRALCESEESIPIFSQSWWLDATAGEANWDVAIVKKGEKISAAMPYFVKKRYGLVFLTSPKLTQTLGPWIRKGTANYSKELSQQKEIMTALIDQLPKFHYFSQNWHHSQANWLPFFWKGFEQTTRYTYVLSDLGDMDSLWAGLQSNIKREIKKADNRFKLHIRTDVDIDDFINLNFLTYERQNKKPPYSRNFIHKLDNACTENNARKIFIAEDEEGKQHAGVYIIWNKHSSYYLMGGGDPELRNSGATSLCMWKAIEFSSKVSNQFDFEGSMLEPVERFFRAFGAKQTAYHSVYQKKSSLVKIASSVREVLKKT